MENIVGRAGKPQARPLSHDIANGNSGRIAKSIYGELHDAGAEAKIASASPDTRSSKVGGRRLPVSYPDIAVFAAIGDLLIIVAAAIVAGAMYHFAILGTPGELSRNLAAAIFVAVLFVTVTRMRRLYDPTRLLLWNDQVENVAGSWCGAFLLLASGVFTWGVGKDLSRGAILLFWAIGGLALLAHRAFWRSFLPRALTNGSLRGRKVVVISRDAPMTPAFAALLRRHGYVTMGEFTMSSSVPQSKATLERVVSFVRGSEIEEIFLVVKDAYAETVRSVLEHLRVLPLPVTLLPDNSLGEIIRHPWYELGRSVAVEIQRPPMMLADRVLKRTIDIVLASIVLVLWSPLLALVAIAIKLDSPGPIIFRQTRHGFNGKPFDIFKFRTMRVLECGEVVRQAKRDDPRVTRVGYWLRRASLDEMPQFVNVLLGEMSIVGPRPHASKHEANFDECIQNYAFRQHVKSGITGWAQIHGARGETDTLEKMQRRVKLDLWYVAHWSIWLDLMIILRTVAVVLTARNAY